MDELTYQTLNQVLLQVLPELRDAYEKLIEHGDEGPHVVYEDVLGPRLRDALKNPIEHGDFLRRVFELLESLENHEDSEVENVGAVSVIELLIDSEDSSLLEEATKWMGPASIKTVTAMKNWRPSH